MTLVTQCQLVLYTQTPMLAVIMGYSAMLSVSFNQVVTFKQVFWCYYCRAPRPIAVDRAYVCNREDTVSLSSKYQKETPVG